jgi:hypothetical protein
MVRSTSARPGKIKKEEVPLLILRAALFGNSNKRERRVRPHLISLYYTQYTCLSCIFRRPRSRFQGTSIKRCVIPFNFTLPHKQHTSLSCLFCRPRSRFQLRYTHSHTQYLNASVDTRNTQNTPFQLQKTDMHMQHR